MARQKITEPNAKKNTSKRKKISKKCSQEPTEQQIDPNDTNHAVNLPRIAKQPLSSNLFSGGLRGYMQHHFTKKITKEEHKENPQYGKIGTFQVVNDEMDPRLRGLPNKVLIDEQTSGTALNQDKLCSILQFMEPPNESSDKDTYAIYIAADSVGHYVPANDFQIFCYNESENKKHKEQNAKATTSEQKLAVFEKSIKEKCKKYHSIQRYGICLSCTADKTEGRVLQTFNSLQQRHSANYKNGGKQHDLRLATVEDLTNGKNQEYSDWLKEHSSNSQNSQLKMSKYFDKDTTSTFNPAHSLWAQISSHGMLTKDFGQPRFDKIVQNVIRDRNYVQYVSAMFFGLTDKDIIQNIFIPWKDFKADFLWRNSESETQVKSNIGQVSDARDSKMTIDDVAVEVNAKTVIFGKNISDIILSANLTPQGTELVPPTPDSSEPSLDNKSPPAKPLSQRLRLKKIMSKPKNQPKNKPKKKQTTGEITKSERLSGKAKQDLEEASKERQYLPTYVKIIVPEEAISKFAHCATKQIGKMDENRKETCAWFGGIEQKDGSRVVTHMYFPEQTATSDSCYSSAEAETQWGDYCLKRQLRSLGMIHSHPGYDVFLSGVDLHIACFAQVIDYDAISIVYSVHKDQEPQYAALRVKPCKMLEVRKCRNDSTQLHDIHNFHNGAPFVPYEQCENVVYDPSKEVIVVDCRDEADKPEYEFGNNEVELAQKEKQGEPKDTSMAEEQAGQPISSQDSRKSPAQERTKNQIGAPKKIEITKSSSEAAPDKLSGLDKKCDFSKLSENATKATKLIKIYEVLIEAMTRQMVSESIHEAKQSQESQTQLEGLDKNKDETEAISLFVRKLHQNREIQLQEKCKAWVKLVGETGEENDQSHSLSIFYDAAQCFIQFQCVYGSMTEKVMNTHMKALEQMMDLKECQLSKKGRQTRNSSDLDSNCSLCFVQKINKIAELLAQIIRPPVGKPTNMTQKRVFTGASPGNPKAAQGLFMAENKSVNQQSRDLIAIIQEESKNYVEKEKRAQWNPQTKKK